MGKKKKYYKFNKFLLIFVLLIEYIIINEKQLYKLFQRNNYFQNSKTNCSKSMALANILESEENRTFILSEGKKFIDKCLKEKYNTKIYKHYDKPKISSIIPVYNKERNILSSIRSIQNQNFSNLEIILIDDYSTDNSSKIIMELKNNDSRIKLITNKKNMGTLYSRSIGILISKGKYIFPLDNDDMFFYEGIFDYIFKIAQEFNFNIVGFRAFKTNDGKYNIKNISDLYKYQNYPKNIVIYQPELGSWMIKFKGHYTLHDVTVWAKCIKSSIYKKATLKLGIKNYSKFVSWAEDAIINYIIFNLAHSFIFIHKYGIIHIYSESTASFSMPNDIKLFGFIFLIDVIYDFCKNNNDKNFAALFTFYMKRHYNIYRFFNNSNLIYFKNILNKFLNDPYISQKNKNKIRKNFKTFF